MSDIADADDTGGYRATGKHRFAAKVISLFLATALIGVVLSFFIGDARSTHWLRLITAAMWIVQSTRSILMSDEQLTDSDPVWSDASPSTLRGWSVMALISFTVLATLETQSLFVPE